jgi:hypothetical protein
MIPWFVQTIYRETETKAAHYTNVRKHPKDLLPFQTKQEEKKKKRKNVIIVLYYTNTLHQQQKTPTPLGIPR